MIYGIQFYVFRGNIYDFFSYLSTASIISNYTYDEILEIISHSENRDLLLKQYASLVHARPSVQIFLATINNFTNLDIFLKGFLFKSICILLTFISSYSFFYNYFKKNKQGIFYSLGFVFSSFFIYIYEIDALAHLLSLPLIIIIFKNLLNIKVKTKNNFFDDLIIIIFYASVFFIIYPEGASVLLPPIGIYFIYLIVVNTNTSSANKVYFLISSLLLFLLLCLPLYKSTFNYLLFNQIANGLDSNNNFWGYFGAFILGKDNPIYDGDSILLIKNLWSESASIFEIIKSVLYLNKENDNHFYYLNILPSIFGFFHLTTSSKIGFINYFFLLFLVLINILILKIILKNLNWIFKNTDNKSFFYKIIIVYFFILIFFLFLNKNYWVLIKVYSFYSFFLYIFIIYDFKKNFFTNKFIVLILICFPLYKYTMFNYGIGAIDSFPSVMKKELKTDIRWFLDYSKISNCKHTKYKFDNNFKNLYVKLALNDFNLYANNKDKIYDCEINYNNNGFQILKYE